MPVVKFIACLGVLAYLILIEKSYYSRQTFFQATKEYFTASSREPALSTYQEAWEMDTLLLPLPAAAGLSESSLVLYWFPIQKFHHPVQSYQFDYTPSTRGTCEQ
jgi:hypothetical protein